MDVSKFRHLRIQLNHSITHQMGRVRFTGFVASRSRTWGPVRKQTLRCWEIRMPTTRSLHQTPSVRRESIPLQMTLTM